MPLSMDTTLVGDLHQCLCSVSRADGLPRFNALRIHASIPLCVHHSLEREHVHALRSRERGCFLVVQTLWAEKIQSTSDAGSLNTFGRNEIEAAPNFIGTSSHCVFSNTIQNLSSTFSRPQTGHLLTTLSASASACLARQRPLHCERAAGMIGASGDNAEVTAGLCECCQIHVGLFSRLLDVADALGAMGPAQQRALIEKTRRRT